MPSTAQHIALVARGFRAQFWTNEFAHLNRRRLALIGAGTLINGVMVAAGMGWSSPTVLLGNACWLLTVAALELVRRRLIDRDVVLIWSTAACVIDSAFITLQMHNWGGGWWLGVPFFGLVAAIGATSLPRRYGRIVFASTLLGWSVVLALPALGIMSPRELPGSLQAIGNPEVLFTQYVFGLLSIVGMWVMLRAQVVRSRRTLDSYRRMVEASPYATFTLAANGDVREANPASLHITGFRAEEVMGRSLLSHVPRETRPLVLEMFERTLQGEVVHFEHELLCGDGAVHWFSVTYSPVDSGVGDRSVLAIARDTTRERAAALANETLQRELAESRRMQLVGRLVSGVAHELNNPLAAVMSFTEQLLHERHEDETREVLGVIHAQAGRARAIVRDLLQVVRDRGERERTPTDLASVIAGSIDALRPAFLERGVRVVQHTENSGPRAVVDPVGMAQVIDNILRNALLASPRDGNVAVQSDWSAAGWTITVTDEGPGVPEHVRALLFEPFFTTRAVGQGTGLGLAVSQGIVDQHGGSLVLDETRDDTPAGASFTVRLPAALAAPHDDQTVSANDSIFSIPSLDTPANTMPPATHPPCLLLIDDEAAIRMALQRFLTRRGWVVETCASGLEARDLLMEADAGARFDAIVCDLKMPGMTGIQLYQQLEIHQPEILDRWIFATGDVASQDVAGFLETVKCPVLEKPFSLASLADLLETLRARSADATP
jgi:PAS domain S-box-containing protein